MTVHLLPCGTSILRTPRPRVLEQTLDGNDVRDVKHWAATTLGADGLVHPDRWAVSFEADLGHLSDPLRTCPHPVRLSAETASLHRHNPRPAPTDQVVLLASDTPEGLASALLVGVALGRPVHVHPRPLLDGTTTGAKVVDGVGAPVHVMRIEGLLPDSTDQFTRATRGLAQAVVWAARLHRLPGVPLVIHLTGGYKATLPYLVTLAEFVRAAWPPVEAWCLHEGDEDDHRPPGPVRIWLRRVDLDADLEILARAESGKLPTDSRLLDFAYANVNGVVELTPLGEGLSAIAVYLRNSL